MKKKIGLVTQIDLSLIIACYNEEKLLRIKILKDALDMEMEISYTSG